MTAVRVVGLHELRLALIEAGRKAPDEIAKTSAEAARLVAGTAKGRAPSGPHEGGGKVAPIRSTIDAGREGLAGTVSIGGAKSPHAEVVNFGGTIPRKGTAKEAIAHARQSKKSFQSVGIKSLTRIVSREFLYSSLAARDRQVVELYADAVDRVLRRAFPR